MIRAATSDARMFLSASKLFVEGDVVIAVSDGIQRGVVVVVKRGQHRRRISIEDVVHADSECRAPEQSLPDRWAGGIHLRGHDVGILGISRRGLVRFFPGVAQLQVERDVARHGPDPSDEVRTAN